MALTVLAEFPSLPEAEIAATVLGSADIVAVVLDDANIALNPITMIRHGYRLAVSDEDLDIARQVLAAATGGVEEAG